MYSSGLGIAIKRRQRVLIILKVAHSAEHRLALSATPLHQELYLLHDHHLGKPFIFTMLIWTHYNAERPMTVGLLWVAHRDGQIYWSARFCSNRRCSRQNRPKLGKRKPLSCRQRSAPRSLFSSHTQSPHELKGHGLGQPQRNSSFSFSSKSQSPTLQSFLYPTLESIFSPWPSDTLPYSLLEYT